MTGHGALAVRRWAVGAVLLLACTWLSTLGPTGDPASPLPLALGGGKGARAVAEARAETEPKPKPKPKPVDCVRARCVALTFDDGPTRSTEKLLDILAVRRVKATFFLVGRNVNQRPDLVRRERAAGHELANHSYTHADLGAASKAKVTSELERTQRAIQRAAGVTPTLMRPPYGSTDGQVADVTRDLKLAQILWSVDPLDWRVRDSDKVERKVVKRTERGAIILLHDIHKTSVEAVPAIIERLAAKGFTFVTVSELYGKPLEPGRKYEQREPPPPPSPAPSPDATDPATSTPDPSAG